MFLVESGGISEQTWNSYTQTEKRQYIKDHPNSKWAEIHKAEQNNKKIKKYKDEIKRLKLLRSKYKRKSNLDKIDSAIKKLRAKIKGLDNVINSEKTTPKQTIQKTVKTETYLPQKQQKEIYKTPDCDVRKLDNSYLNARKYYLIKQAMKVVPNSDAQKRVYEKLWEVNDELATRDTKTTTDSYANVKSVNDELMELMKIPYSEKTPEQEARQVKLSDKLHTIKIQPEESLFEGHNESEIADFKKQVQEWNDYVDRSNRSFIKMFNKREGKHNRLVEEYKSAISFWLNEKRKAPNSETTKEYGAKVGELKKKVGESQKELDDYKEEHKEELKGFSSVPSLPKFNKIRKFTQEELNRPSGRYSRYSRRRF